MPKLIISIVLLLLSGLPANALQPELEAITLQLDWKFQFEYAGFIAAKENGFYEELGLDVTLLEYQSGIDTVADVIKNKVTYGIHNSSLVVADKKIQPIVLMATYFQRSPLVLITKPEINNPADLVGKTIMGTKDELKYSSLALTLDHFTINNDNSTIIEHSFNVDDFINGKVDAMSGFLSNQIYELDRRNTNYNIINPADYGFFMSAVNLFTSADQALRHPQRCRKFVEATNRGWAYAFSHRDEVVQLIHEKYAPEKSIAALTFEAEITKKMFLQNLYPIGAVNKELTVRTFKQLKNHDVIDEELQLNDYLLEDILKKGELSFRRQASTIIPFTQEELSYLDRKQSISMCVDPNWMPFEMIESGEHYGIAADYMSLFEEQLPIPIQLIPTESWQESLQLAQERDCDIFSLAASTPVRRQYMNFTSPYISLPVVMATTTEKIFIDDIQQILNEKIGVVKGYAIADHLRSAYPGINIIDVASISDGLEQVECGELYCYIDNLMVIAEQIQKRFTGVIKVSGRVQEKVHLAVATRNDEPILKSIFNKLVLNVTPDQKQAIYNKWVAIKQEVAFDYTLLWKLFAALLFVVGLFGVHYYQLRKYNRLLLTLSETDKLTGLYNRLRLDELLIEQEQLFVRYTTPCGVVLLDIDHFKRVNDTYGHQAGDTVLVELANLMKQNIRNTDIVGRWGGEEFLIIAPNSNNCETALLAEKLLNRLREHRFANVGLVTASFGVSSFAEGKTVTATLRLADEALYKAKENGRNQVVQTAEIS